MKEDVYIEDLLEELKGKGLVRLILDENFNPNIKKHPIEFYFSLRGIPYYFDGDGVGKKSDYKVNLRKINVIYSKIPIKLKDLVEDAKKHSEGKKRKVNILTSRPDSESAKRLIRSLKKAGVKFLVNNRNFSNFKNYNIHLDQIKIID